MITKKHLRNLVPGTTEYVTAHAQWRKKRGKLNPSEQLSIIKNPKRALVIAKNYIENYKKFPAKKNDIKYQDEILLDVEEHKAFFSIRTNCGSLCIDKETRITPKAGQLVRFYFIGRDAGIGSTIRGIDFEGNHCRYKTEQQIRDEYDQWIENEDKRRKQKFLDEEDLLNKRYHQLPKVFKQRIDRFRNNNPDFRWKYEGLESSLCVQAVLVAKYLHKQTGTKKKIGALEKESHTAYIASVENYFHQFKELPTKMQLKLVKGLDDNHSGNSFSHLLSLAFYYLCYPKNVVLLHGWLTAIVGAEEFGDVPRKEVA